MGTIIVTLAAFFIGDADYGDGIELEAVYDGTGVNPPEFYRVKATHYCDINRGRLTTYPPEVIYDELEARDKFRQCVDLEVERAMVMATH